VPPDIEGLYEAIDVLGHAQLLDSALRGGLPVALGVLAREVALGRASVLVRAEMDVIVRQQRSASTIRRSVSRVTLMFSGGASTTLTVPPMSSTREASSVAAASAISSRARA
jgi:hypothetical protein